MKYIHFKFKWKMWSHKPVFHQDEFECKSLQVKAQLDKLVSSLKTGHRINTLGHDKHLLKISFTYLLCTFKDGDLSCFFQS